MPQPHSTPRLIVFDLDGTLVDSRRDLADSVNAMLIESGRPPLEVGDVTKMVGEGARLLVERALAASEASVGCLETPRISLAHALERFLVHYDSRLLNHTYAYDGVAAWLESLQRHATLAVLTNKPRDASVRILEGLGLARYFSEVLGADGPHPRKPDPAALLDLMNRRGVARQDTLFIGDSRIDLATARNADVRVCLVRYGFGFRFTAGELPPEVTVIDHPGEDCFAIG